MTGYLLLEGGAEFGGQMAEPDRRAIALAGGSAAQISIIPTAAAPDNNYRRAGENGVRWFQSLGATNVAWVPLIDRASANDPGIADTLSRARLVYMLGGFPGYLGETLKDSTCWQAVLRAYEHGAVIAGSSAGAMVMCQYYSDPRKGGVVEGLGLVPNTCVLPHHNTFGKRWAPLLAEDLPGVTLLGIDEYTGMLDDGDAGRTRGWRVYGAGAVTIYRAGEATVYQAGETFDDDCMPQR